MKLTLSLSLVVFAAPFGTAFPQYRVHEVVNIGTNSYVPGMHLSESGFATFSVPVPVQSFLYSLATGITTISQPSPEHYFPSWVGEDGSTAGSVVSPGFEVGTAALRSISGDYTVYEKYIDVGFEAIHDVNSSGFAVGVSSWFSSSAALYWTPDGLVHELPNISNQFTSTATAINSGGMIVGTADSGTILGRACYWNLSEPGTPRHEFERLPGMRAFVNDVNELGQAWGSGVVGAQRYHMLWNSEGQIVHAIPINGNGSGFAINDNGLALGNYGPELQTIPGIWSAATGHTDLNSLLEPGSSSYHLITARDINNRGEIVAYAIKDGHYRGVFLEPVPEPATLATLGLGLVAMTRKSRRNTRHENTARFHTL